MMRRRDRPAGPVSLRGRPIHVNLPSRPMFLASAILREGREMASRLAWSNLPPAGKDDDGIRRAEARL